MPAGAKYGGRKKGTPNKVTAEVREFAGKYTRAAIRGLVRLAKTAKSEQARVAAWREVLDRAVGRPAQSVDLTNSDGSLQSAWKSAIRAADGIGEQQSEADVTH
jgi:hypothetical protein